ncbi:hypothetical protein lerEdw1_011514 [Lerista edwardsae]|nr:hypothetical protein lerEdw1_011514 [Lerista edwardsae]
MGAGEGALLPLCLLALLALPGAEAVTVEDTFVQLTFFQESFPSQKMSGEFLDEFDEEEIFHVDWGRKETIWRLPDFTTFTSFETQGALGNLATIKTNMEILMKRSNRTQAQKGTWRAAPRPTELPRPLRFPAPGLVTADGNREQEEEEKDAQKEPSCSGLKGRKRQEGGEEVAPSATVYPKHPMELGDPNVLICLVDQFFPPVLNITWLKNGEEVSEGVEETDFYPRTDSTFRKFSYLPFVPEAGDSYVCRVDHWGLAESLSKLWHCQEPPHLPETLENAVCALGLALGILGIVAGTVLCVKARQGGEGSRRGGAR